MIKDLKFQQDNPRIKSSVLIMLICYYNAVSIKIHCLNSKYYCSGLWYRFTHTDHFIHFAHEGILNDNTIQSYNGLTSDYCLVHLWIVIHSSYSISYNAIDIEITIGYVIGSDHHMISSVGGRVNKTRVTYSTVVLGRKSWLE